MPTNELIFLASIAGLYLMLAIFCWADKAAAGWAASVQERALRAAAQIIQSIDFQLA